MQCVCESIVEKTKYGLSAYISLSSDYLLRGLNILESPSLLICFFHNPPASLVWTYVYHLQPLSNKFLRGSSVAKKCQDRHRYAHQYLVSPILGPSSTSLDVALFLILVKRGVAVSVILCPSFCYEVSRTMMRDGSCIIRKGKISGRKSWFHKKKKRSTHNNPFWFLPFLSP